MEGGEGGEYVLCIFISSTVGGNVGMEKVRTAGLLGKTPKIQNDSYGPRVVVGRFWVRLLFIGCHSVSPSFFLLLALFLLSTHPGNLSLFTTIRPCLGGKGVRYEQEVDRGARKSFPI